MKMEKKRNGKGLALLTAAFGAAFCLSACGLGENNRPVIAERTSGAEETAGSEKAGGTEETDGNGKAVGTENAGEEENEAEEGILGLLEPPDRYQAQVETEKLSLICDAELRIPDNVSMKAAQVRTKPYSEEEYEAYSQAAAAAAGTVWAETSKRQTGTAVDMDSEDGNYLLSFVSGEEEGSPILWMTDYRRFAGKKLTGAEVESERSKEEKIALEERLKKKAEEILRTLSGEEFAAEEAEWRRINSRDGENDGLGLCFTFRRTWNGVPVMTQELALFGEAADSAQYVRIVFAEDGTLVELKDIGRETIEENGEDGGFFLPFAAAAEVFEQYCRSYYEDESHVPLSPAFLKNPDPASGEASLFTSVKVGRVCLEYRYEAEKAEESADSSGGSLVPVWNFYGTGTVGWRTDHGKEGGETSLEILDGEEILLVSIGAEDGRVYGN